MRYLKFWSTNFTAVFLAILLLCSVNLILAAMPSFDRPSENVTVIIGNAAVLPCFINNLGDHKVAWIKVANMDILAIGDYKVTNDDRIRLLHGYVSDWSLSIQPVNEEDAGEYICQVNTEPQIITRIHLDVLLPPKIIEEKSTVIPSPIKEGDSLSMYCHAEGIPTPKVTWYFREKSTAAKDSSSVNHHFKRHEKNSKHEKNADGRVIQVGNTLTLNNISRSYSGIFECIANNSVPPAASRKIKITIEFAPELTMQHDKVERMLGQEARFECKIKASPLKNHYWMKDGVVIDNVINGIYLEHRPVFSNKNEFEYQMNSRVAHSKYDILVYNQNSNENSLVSALTIKNLTKSDFGIYQCFGINAHNTTIIEAELKEILRRSSTSKTKSSSRILVFGNSKNEGQNQINHLNRHYINENTKTKNLFNKEYSLTTYMPKHQRRRFNYTSKNAEYDDYTSEESYLNSFNFSNSSNNGLRQLMRTSFKLNFCLLLMVVAFFQR